jgi:ribosome modulation factor
MIEDDRFMAICQGHEAPEPAAFQAGHDAHAAGLSFHECPYQPSHSVASLSWRIGWNHRALSQH